MPLTLQVGDMGLIRQVLMSGYIRIQAGDCVCLSNMGTKLRTFSFIVRTFYEGNEYLGIFIIQHLQVLELIEKWKLT